MGYIEAAELTNEVELDEPEEVLKDKIPEGFRLVSILNDGPTRIESEVSDAGWEEMVVFTHPDASFDWAQEFAEFFAGEGDFRVIFDWNRESTGNWVLEHYPET